MKILILTAGSRGDIQPFVALGIGLAQAGYQVQVAAPALFANFVEQYRLPFAPIDDEFLRLKDTAEGRAIMENPGKGLGLIKKVLPMLARMMRDSWSAAQGADLIIYHPKTLAAPHISEKLGIPRILSLPLPAYTPTSSFANPIMPDLGLGRLYNRLSYGVTRLITAPFMGIINEWRAEIGLPPAKRFMNELRYPDGSPVPTLYSYSSHVVPTPPDWDDMTRATGYWMLPDNANWMPPQDLLQFLEDGAPPIYIGFGSMMSTDPSAKIQRVLQAIEKTGQRAIIARGWGGLQADNVPTNVFLIDEAPHTWLFPRLAAVVHHGGAGTTAAGLIAGKTTIICPFMADQPFWGRQVVRLRVGPTPIPQRKLTVENLSRAIHDATTNSKMRENAARLGEKLRAEDGVGQAIARIRQLVGQPMPSSA